MNIGDKQIQLINYAKFFLKRLESSNIKTSLSSFCYLTPWAETPGYARLKLWLNGWKYSLKFCVILLKNIFIISSHSKYVVIGNRSTQSHYDILVLSWSFKKNFQSDCPQQFIISNLKIPKLFLQ